MRSSAISLVVVAVVSSAATVAAIELLRGARPVPQPALPVEPPSATSAARASREVAPLPPAAKAPDPLAGYEERLAELERRLAALERGPARQPATAASTRPPPEDELRDAVLAWVAEEREARGRSEQLDAEARRRAQRSFDARYHAYMVALENGLPKWQEEKLSELYLEIEERTAEIEDAIDVSSDDPEEIEARWVEFDAWCDQRERALGSVVGPELYAKIFGD